MCATRVRFRKGRKCEKIFAAGKLLMRRFWSEWVAEDAILTCARNVWRSAAKLVGFGPILNLG